MSEIELMELLDGHYVSKISSRRQRSTSKEKYNILANGMKHGKYMLYYNSGKKKLRLTYNAGVLNGKCKLWNKEGNLVSNVCYKDGILA